MPPAANDILTDRGIRHAVFMQRFTTSETRRTLGLINNRIIPELTKSIEKEMTKVARLGSSKVRLNRLRSTLTKTRGILGGGAKLLQEKATPKLAELAVTESQWQRALLQKSVPPLSGIAFRDPSPAVLKQLTSTSLVLGTPIQNIWDGWSTATQMAVRQQLAAGLTIGESIPQLSRRIASVANKSRRDATTIVRTAVNHISSQAREATYKQNEDVVKAVRIVATLDARTTEICMGQDGQIYPINEGWRPPGHHQCRTTTVPVLKSWKELGFNLKDIPPGTRASMNGQVPATETYGQWLRKQSSGVQNAALGKGKAEVFRRGNVDIRKFTDGNNRPLTLKQLTTLEAKLAKAPVAGSLQLKPPVITKPPAVKAPPKKVLEKASKPKNITKTKSTVTPPAAKGPPPAPPALPKGQPLAKFGNVTIDQQLAPDMLQVIASRGELATPDIKWRLWEWLHQPTTAKNLYKELNLPSAVIELRLRSGKIAVGKTLPLKNNVKTGANGNWFGEPLKVGNRRAVVKVEDGPLAGKVNPNTGEHWVASNVEHRIKAINTLDDGSIEIVVTQNVDQGVPNWVKAKRAAAVEDAKIAKLGPQPAPPADLPSQGHLRGKRLDPRTHAQIDDNAFENWWFNRLDAADRQVIDEFTGEGAVTYAIRDHAVKGKATAFKGGLTGKAADRAVKDWIRKFERVADKSPRYAGTSYRGMGGLKQADVDQFKVGNVVTMRGPTSSSSEREVALNFMGNNSAKKGGGQSVLLRIKNKTGLEVGRFDVDRVGNFPEEAEVMLRHNSQYRVVKTGLKELEDEWGDTIKAMQVDLQEI